MAKKTPSFVKDTSKDIAWYRARIALTKARQASIIAEDSPTLEHYKSLAQCWEDSAKLFKEFEDTHKDCVKWGSIVYVSGIVPMDEEFKKAKNDENEALAKQILDEYKEKIDDILDISYRCIAIYQEYSANHFDKLANLKKEAGDVKEEMKAKLEASCRRAKVAKLIANKYRTANNFKNAAQCCEDAAELVEKFRDIECREGRPHYLPFSCRSNFQSQSAWYKAKQASIITDNYNTVQNCKDAVRLWNIAATLLQKDKNIKKEIYAKMYSLWYIAKQATIIAKNNNTANSFKIEGKCYNTLAKIARKFELDGFVNASIDLEDAAFVRAKIVGEILKINNSKANHENDAKLLAILAALKEEAGNILGVK